MTAKILVVDDSMMVRTEVGQPLEAAGFEVVEASDGAEALAKLGDMPEMALVVLDVNMPRMNGIELLRQLAARELLSRIPVIMLTTEGHPQLMREAKSLGAKGWIVKPFRAEHLVAAVRKLTGLAT